MKKQRNIAETEQITLSYRVTPENAPPLPELTNNAPTIKPVAHNDWRTLVETAPVYAETSLLLVTKTIPLAARTAFRTGTIHFDESGITIAGMVPKPFPKWLSWVSLVAMLPQVGGQMLASFGKTWGIPFPVRVALLTVGFSFLLIPVLLRRRFDNDRIEAKQLLSWESLHAIQVDPKLRHITLVYHSFATPPRTALALYESITLNKLEPNTVAGIAETIQQLAPGVLRENRSGNQNIRWVWIIVTTTVVFVILVIVVMVIIYIRRHVRP